MDVEELKFQMAESIFKKDDELVRAFKCELAKENAFAALSHDEMLNLLESVEEALERIDIAFQFFDDYAVKAALKAGTPSDVLEQRRAELAKARMVYVEFHHADVFKREVGDA